jgi:drug/metabolite transporter (DMT)-like permease
MSGTANKPIQTILPVALLVQNFFALVPIAVKSTSADPLSIAVIRLLITVFCLSFFTRDFFRYLKQDFVAFLTLGSCFALHWYTYFTAVKLGSPSIALLGLSSYGIFVNIYALIFLKERFSPVTLGAVIVSIFGVYLVASGSTSSDSKALLVAIFSASVYGLLPILHKKNLSIPTMVRVQFQFAGALLVFLFFSSNVRFSYNLNDWIWLLYLAFGGTLLGHGLWVLVTSHSSAFFVSLIYYVNIPLVLMWEVYFFGKTLSQIQILGACIMIFAQISLAFRSRFLASGRKVSVND